MCISGTRDQPIEGTDFALKVRNRARTAPRLVARGNARRNDKLHAAANHYLQDCKQSENWMLAFDEQAGQLR
jgi:Holliday junction resolvase-like predicted endonuclease